MIPKSLHFIWISQGGIHRPEEYDDIPDKWSGLNPGWTVRLWDYESLREFIGGEFPEHVDRWSKLDMAVKQSDMARLLLLQSLGGIYLDWDLDPFPQTQGVLDRFFADRKVYNLYCTEGKLPEVPSVDFKDVSSFGTVFSRENCRIDRAGHGLANNMLISHPDQPWIMDFIDRQKDAHRGLVLDFLGPWAITRFWRSRLAEDRESVLKKQMTTIPPHYFIWEQNRMSCQPPRYTISAHTGENTWGDKGRRDWWKV